MKSARSVRSPAQRRSVGDGLWRMRTAAAKIDRADRGPESAMSSSAQAPWEAFSGSGVGRRLSRRGNLPIPFRKRMVTRLCFRFARPQTPSGETGKGRRTMRTKKTKLSSIEGDETDPAPPAPWASSGDDAGTSGRDRRSQPVSEPPSPSRRSLWLDAECPDARVVSDQRPRFLNRQRRRPGRGAAGRRRSDAWQRPRLPDRAQFSFVNAPQALPS